MIASPESLLIGLSGSLNTSALANKRILSALVAQMSIVHLEC